MASVLVIDVSIERYVCMPAAEDLFLKFASYGWVLIVESIDGSDGYFDSFLVEPVMGRYIRWSFGEFDFSF